MELEETDRLFKCPYCRTRLFITATSEFRYWLSPRTPASKELLFVPYWRFKGLYLAITRGKTKMRFIDTTHIGLKLEGLPMSLGVRPQALTLRYVTPEMPHFFIHHDPFKKIFTLIDTGLQETETLNFRVPASGPQDIIARTYIGETKSVLYTPVYVREQTVFDAVTDTPLCNSAVLQQMKISKPKDWGLSFLGALCPSCGWDLEAERDSLVLFCRNCNSAWAAQGSTLKKQPYQIALPVKESSSLLLPFWKLKASVSPLKLQTYYDLVRFANLPKVPQKHWQEKEFYFWVPAFKLQPERFLQLTRIATLAQMNATQDISLPQKKRLFPVTLASEEAEEVLTALVLEISRPRKKVLDVMPELTIKVIHKQLVLVPFEETQYMYLQPQMNFGVSKGLLRFGRNI